MNLSKKHQLKDYLRIFVLIGVSVLLWNCEKEEEVIIDPTISNVDQSIKPAYKIESLTFKQANQEPIFSKLKKQFDVENTTKRKTGSFKTQTKASSNSGDRDFTNIDASIDMSTIKKITGTDYVSYTMRLDEPENTTSTFSNVVVQQNNDIEDIYTIKYTPTQSWVDDKTKPFDGDIKLGRGMVPFDGWSPDESEGGGGGSDGFVEVCRDVKVLVPVSCGCDHMPGDDCDGCKGNYPSYKEVTRRVCTWEHQGSVGNNDNSNTGNTNQNNSGGGSSGAGNSNVITTPIGEVVPEGLEEIIIDLELRLKYPCQSDIIYKTNKNSYSDLGQLITDVFEGNSENINLFFKSDKDDPINDLAITYPEAIPTINANGEQELNVTIVFSSTLLNNGTELAIARTAIHEQVHALLVYLHETDQLLENSSMAGFDELMDAYIQFKVDNQTDPVSKTQHEIMAGLVEDMATALHTDFGSADITYDYCKTLMWGGLMGTDTFKNSFPRYLPNGVTDNPEYIKINNASVSEAENKTIPYVGHPDGNDYTTSPKSTPCSN